MTLPLLLWLLGITGGAAAQKWAESGIKGFNVLLIAVLVFVFGANVFVYEEWKTPLNNRAVEYFKTPQALLDSMSFIFKTISFLLFAGGVWLFWRLYKKTVGTSIYPRQVSRWGALSLPVWLGLLVLAIRGGTDVMPINESAVYRSAHLFDNHAATNPGWSLGHSLLETRSTLNRFQFLSTEEAVARKNALLHADSGAQAARGFFAMKDSAARPNMVFLILESHTAQVVESLGGEPGVCPQLEALIGQGILFEHVLGSGYRTDQGVVSLLAGYPAQPDQSIILLDDKASKLPSLPKMLHGEGYQTLFLYGGQLTFANLGLWLANQRFDKVLSERHFPAEEKTQRWGADDLHLFRRTVRELNRLREPFMACAMTLSLHPPYDVPFQSRWKGRSGREQFLNSAAFVDHAIGEFFRSAAQQPWYANTIFVLVADHGASQPGDVGMHTTESRHLPIIVVGEPLAAEWRGKRNKAWGNHHDLPATLLGMLGKEHGAFDWSRNLWAGPEGEGFAYYTNESVLGWATPRGAAFYEFGRKKWASLRGELSEDDHANAQAYLQTLYDDFLKK
jgi:phosphoglycerol transferase MdoB-like AlkP superfamily enzyme